MKRTDKDIEFLCVKLYEEGNSYKTISEKLKANGVFINSVTVFNICKRYGVKSRNKGGKEDFTEEEIIMMNKLYYEDFWTLKEISEKFNCVVNTVKKYVSKDSEYKRRTLLNYKNMDLVHNFFENIDTEIKAYILGYLIADGNVYKDTSSYRVRIELNEKDLYFINLFKESVRCNNVIGHREKQSLKVMSKTVRFCLTSEKMFNDLSKYGVVPNKTRITYLPILNKEMMPHLIRGILDGDGWISSSVKHKGIGFTGSRQLILDIKRYLINELNLSNVSICVAKKENESMHATNSVCWRGKTDIVKLGMFLYENANYFLERKYQNFINYNL